MRHPASDPLEKLIACQLQGHRVQRGYTVEWCMTCFRAELSARPAHYGQMTNLEAAVHDAVTRK